LRKRPLAKFLKFKSYKLTFFVELVLIGFSLCFRFSAFYPCGINGLIRQSTSQQYCVNLFHVDDQIDVDGIIFALFLHFRVDQFFKMEKHFL
jgi:hypothetical protein